MVDSIFIGREEEKAIINELLNQEGSDLVAVLGRRRVGKTYLIKEAFKMKFDFYFTGIKNSDKDTTITAFITKLQEYSKSPYPLDVPEDWFSTFQMLKKYLSTIKSKRKKVIFLDEMPWMDTHLSNFLPAFEYFWNDWAVNQNIIVVICGSATSWMLENVRNNTGGLHNRVSKYIHVEPFTLSETAKYFKSRKINLNQYEIAHLYMAVGGIPYYLKEVVNKESAVQNIDRMFFNPKSTLKNEFINLYRSLFTAYHNYEEVVKALAKAKKGLTRGEIASATKISNGGGLTKVLSELEECSFIQTYQPFGKEKRDTIYQLVDEFTLFYYQFSPDKKPKGSFLSQQSTPKLNAWKGLSFELLCLKHIDKIKAALGITGVFSTQHSFFRKGSTSSPGFQIDLLIDRNDNVICICEMKYSTDNYTITKLEYERLRKKREGFISLSGTKKHVMMIMVTSYDITPNKYSIGLIDNNISLSSLF